MPVVPTWFRVHGGFALQSGIDRRTAVELWYADDIELTVANEAPNDTTLFQSLPPIGSPSSDPGLTGAIVIDHRIVEPAVKIGSYARAKVAVIYDSEVRYRIEPRFRQSVQRLPPLDFEIPFIALESTATGAVVKRHDEDKPVKRCQWMRLITVRVAGNVGTVISAIQDQCGRRYTLDGVAYLLNEFGINELGNGEVDITYAFWTNARVQSVTSGSGFGEHVLVPALAHLDEYAPDETGGTLSIRLATFYVAGATLPGGIG